MRCFEQAPNKVNAQHILNATHRATFSELLSLLQGGAAADHGHVTGVDTIVSASAPGDATEPRAAMRGGGSDSWVSQRKRRRGAAVRKAEPTPPAQAHKRLHDAILQGAAPSGHDLAGLALAKCPVIIRSNKWGEPFKPLSRPPVQAVQSDMVYTNIAARLINANR